MFNYQALRALALQMGYVSLGHGRHREAFDMHDGNVLKIPLDAEDGTLANWQENSRYIESESYGGNILSPCKLVEFGGWEVLIMEKVEPIECPTELPHWTDCIDNQQVGFTKTGRLVAYDYAD